MTQRKMIRLPLEKLRHLDRSRRYGDKDSLEELAINVRTTGLIQPPLVRRIGGSDQYEIVCGGRRALALRLLGETEIDCELANESLTEADVLKLRWSENAQRVDFDPMEEARLVCRFMDASGLSMSATAKALGKPIVAVSRCHERVHNWDGELQDLVEQGVVPASTGHAIQAIPCPEERREALKQAARGELTRDAAIARAKRPNSAGQNAPRALKRAQAKLANGWRLAVSGEGLTLESFISCLETVLTSARRAHRQGLGLERFLNGVPAKPATELSQARKPSAT
jgi:ParB/RepB/Spo0J family partition protein